MNSIYQQEGRIETSSPIITDDHGISYLGNLDVPARKPSLLYIVSLVLINIIAFLFYLVNATKQDRVVFLPMVFCVFMLLLFWFLHKFRSLKPRNWLSPDVFFTGGFFMVHFPYIILYALGIVPQDPEIFMASDKIMKAVTFCLIGLSTFLIGYELMGAFFKANYANQRIIPINPIAITISKILIFVSLIFFWGTLASMGLGTVLTNYSLITRVGTLSVWGRFFWVSQNIALVAVAMYCTASFLTYHRFMYGKVAMIAALAFIFGILMLGDRGGFLYLATVPFAAFYYYYKKVKIRWLILAVLGIIVAFNVVGLTRDIIGGNVTKVIAEYKYQKQAKPLNPITSTALEFGASIKTVVLAMSVIPEDYSYWYGRSYLNSFKFAVPNVLPGVVRTSIASPEVWLNHTIFGIGLKWGRGGSIAMEAYMNFGFWGGVLFFGVLGGAIRIVYERFLTKPTFVRGVFMLGVLAGMMVWLRNSSEIFTRTPIWALVTAWMVSLIAQPLYRDNLDNQ